MATDYIDLYQLHVEDEATPLEETMTALDDLVRAGKVLYIGASNLRAYRLMKALAISDALGTARFISFQGQYNLIVRTLEREHVPLLEDEGLGFVSWSPLAAGMFDGKGQAGGPIGRNPARPTGHSRRLAGQERARLRHRGGRAEGGGRNRVHPGAAGTGVATDPAGHLR